VFEPGTAANGADRMVIPEFTIQPRRRCIPARDGRQSDGQPALVAKELLTQQPADLARKAPNALILKTACRLFRIRL
jgi:hypothetical protein